MRLRANSRSNRLLLLIAAPAFAALLACGGAPSSDAEPASDEGELSAEYDEPQAEAETAAPATSQAPAAAPKKTTAQAATPPPAPATVNVTIPAGTELLVTMNTFVSSGKSHVGDPVEATTMEPVLIGNRVPIPAGSTIYGEVVEVIPAKKGLKIAEKGGTLVLAFTGLTTPDGYSAPLVATLADHAKSGGKTGGIIGGSAAGGAVLGKVLGGDDEDAAVGAVIGTGIGTAIAAGTKGKEMKIPEGTELLITLEEDFTIEME